MLRHAPGQGDGVAAVVVDDSLRLSRRARRIQDVERIGCQHRNALVDRRRAFDGGLPLEIASRLECCGCRRSLQHHAGVWLDARQARAHRRAAACRRRSGPGSIPHDAQTMTFGRASSMRAASSRDANPPNTTECTAPSRADASIVITASGVLGMKIRTRSPLPTPRLRSAPATRATWSRSSR